MPPKGGKKVPIKPLTKKNNPLRGVVAHLTTKLKASIAAATRKKKIPPARNVTAKLTPRDLINKYFMIFKTPIYAIISRQIEKEEIMPNEIRRLYETFTAAYKNLKVDVFQLQAQAIEIRNAIDKRKNLHTILKNEYTNYKSTQDQKGSDLDGAIMGAYITFNRFYKSPETTYAFLEAGATLLQTAFCTKKQAEVAAVAPLIPIISSVDVAVIGAPDLTPYRTREWDEAKKTGAWLVYKSYFRQQSALIQGLKALLPNKLLLNHPGRKPAYTQGAQALIAYNKRLNAYKQTQAEFDRFNATYLIQKGLDVIIGRLNKGNNKPEGRKSFAELEDLIANEPIVKTNLALLLKCKADVTRIKAEQEQRKNLLKELKDLNQPSEIRKRILQNANKPIYYKLVNTQDEEDIAVPYSNEDITALQSGKLEAEGDIYVEVKRMSMFLALVQLNIFYTFTDEPGLLSRLGRAPPAPSFIARQARQARQGRQRGGAIRFIGEKAFTHTVLQHGQNPIYVKDLIKSDVSEFDVSVYRQLNNSTDDSVLNKNMIRDNGTTIGATEFERNFIEMIGIPNGDPNGQASLLTEAFGMIVPISMAQIMDTGAWKGFNPPPRPDASVIEKFKTPIAIARELAAGGDWVPLDLLYKYTKVLKVVDACHDFPQAFLVVINNAIALCNMNLSEANTWIRGKLTILLMELGTVASQMKLEAFAMQMIDELVVHLSDRYRPFFAGSNSFLPSDQRIIASGNLSDTNNGERATDILAGYVSRIDKVVAFEATDHLHVWGSDGLVAALLKKGCRITKACKRFDNLDAASEAVPIVKYNATREGIPGAPSEPTTKGWTVTYEASDTSREPLDKEAGLLCSSPAEKAALDRVGAADGSRVVLNAGLPNVCEVFSNYGDGRLKVEVYCQINNQYYLICTHGDTPFSVNTIGQLLQLPGGRGGLLTSARGESPLTWSPLMNWLEGNSGVYPDFPFPVGFSNTAVSKKALANILKTNALIDRKCSGDGRMTILFGLGITLDVLAGYFFLLFYGISLILIKGQYKLISLRPLPSDAAMQEEKWKGMAYLKNDVTGPPIVNKALEQYNQVNTLLLKVIEDKGNSTLEPVAYIAASAAFMKLSKNVSDGAMDKDDILTKLGEATLETWPYNNIMGWIENVLQTNTAIQTYNDTVKQLNASILKIATLVPIPAGAGQRGGEDSDDENDDASSNNESNNGESSNNESNNDESNNGSAPPKKPVAAAPPKKPVAAAPAPKKSRAAAPPKKPVAAAPAPAPKKPRAAAAADNNEENPSPAAANRPREIQDMLPIQLQIMDELLKVIINCIRNNEDTIIDTLFYLLKYGCVWNKTDYIYIADSNELIGALQNRLETEAPGSHPPAMIQRFLPRLLARFRSEEDEVAAGPVAAPGENAAMGAAPGENAAMGAAPGENAAMVVPVAVAPVAVAVAPVAVAPEVGNAAAPAAAPEAAPEAEMRVIPDAAVPEAEMGRGQNVLPLVNEGGSLAGSSVSGARSSSANPNNNNEGSIGGRRHHVTRRRKQKSRRK